MEYFIIKKNPLYVYNPEILELGSKIDLQDFKLKGTENIPSRVILSCTVQEYSTFPTFLLERLPLFTSTVKDIINKFYKNVVYKEIVLDPKDHNEMQIYYLAKLKDVQGHAISKDDEKISVKKEDVYNEDIFYLHYKNHVHLCANLIIVEHIYRNGGHGFILEKLSV